MITYDKDGNTDKTLSGFTVPPGQAFKLILVTNDKSTFYENNRQWNCWSHNNDKATLQWKGEGISLMVSDFLMTEWVLCGDTSEANDGVAKSIGGDVGGTWLQLMCCTLPKCLCP